MTALMALLRMERRKNGENNSGNLSGGYCILLLR